MGPTLSKKEISAQIKELYAKIGDSKDCIKAEFRSFGKTSKVYVKATSEYKKAKAAYDKKPKAKQEKKLDAALEVFYQAHDDYKVVYKTIDSYFTAIEKDYGDICDLLEMRGASKKAEKTAMEFEKYRDWLEHKLSVMSDGVPELVEDEQEEEPVEELPEEPAEVKLEAPAPAYTNVAVSPVSINPVILDVSSIVDNAIETTMAKLNLHMEKKLSEYFNNLNLPTATGATTVVKEVVKEVAPVAVSSETTLANVELEGEILTKEQEIYAKLKAMSEEIAAMLQSLEALTESQSALSGKQKDLNGMQKQTNDTLRRIMRDQQGIQVSLRVVNQDQAEVNAQQAAVVESQKLVVEQQQALADAQNGMIETQSAVIATQSGLNDAMKAVMQAQKEILHTQSKIAQGNAKAQEAGKVLLEKQAEFTELQKNALANQRQAMKDYKDATGEGKPARAKKAKQAEEAPAEEVAAE